jgi:DNA-binding PadR family transcriptional regulator
MRRRVVDFRPDEDDPGLYGEFHDGSEEDIGDVYDDDDIDDRYDDGYAYSDDEDDDEAVWGRMMEHEGAGLHIFGRRRRREKDSPSPSQIEPTIDVLLSQGAVIADAVMSVFKPVVRGLKGSNKKQIQALEEGLRDLDRIRKELEAARAEAEDYKKLAMACLERERERNPDMPRVEMERDLQNLQDAGDDLAREFTDIEEEIQATGSTLYETIMGEKDTSENIMKDVSTAMRTEIAEEEQSIRDGDPILIPVDPPALPPRAQPPALPPRDMPPQVPLRIPKKETREIREATVEVLDDAFNGAWSGLKSVIVQVDDERSPEEVAADEAREKAKQAEWEAEWGDAESRIGSRRTRDGERLRASTRPIRARLRAMRRRPVVPSKRSSPARRVPSSRVERSTKKAEEKTPAPVETKEPEVPEASEESSESGEDSLFY